MGKKKPGQNMADEADAVMRSWLEEGILEEEEDLRFVRRGPPDEVMKRQLDADSPYLRLIGEIRYLLSPFGLATRKEQIQEVSQRLLLSVMDPAFRDKVGAQYVLRQEHQDVLLDVEKARWFEELLGGIDPDEPLWLELLELTDHGRAPVPEDRELPGPVPTCVLFLQLCREFDQYEETIDQLVHEQDQAYLAKSRNMWENTRKPMPEPVAASEARSRHLRRLQEDPHYRTWVEKTLQMLLNLVKEDPKMLTLLQETLLVDRPLGFPGEEQFRANLLGMREDIEALFQAVASGEIGGRTKEDGGNGGGRSFSGGHC
ncbi:MAG: hypothetical protein G8237_10160 [Magnetococcales bacterium]|nr:hypothetical protein [Magnetococcales bacterium]